MAADHRSAHPDIAGVPGWAAVVIAVVATSLGFAFDAGSGNSDLSGVFAGAYAIGCVAAVLAVRHCSLFTTVIQPPLILFVAVPTAYFLFTGAAFTGIKNTLINYGYPLIERFPLMLFTSVGVLLIALLRWYFALSRRVADAKSARRDRATARPRRLATLTNRLNFLLHGDDDQKSTLAKSLPTRGGGTRHPATGKTHTKNSTGTARRSRTPRPGKSTARSSDGDPHSSRQWSRSYQEADASGPLPLGYEQWQGRDPYDPLLYRGGGRFEPHPPYDSSRRRSYGNSHLNPHTSPHSGIPDTVSGVSRAGTHHPVSQVRYRGEPADTGEHRTEHSEYPDSRDHPEHRTRRQPLSHQDSEIWRYRS